jgi:hypothetical protein
LKVATLMRPDGSGAGGSKDGKHAGSGKAED